MESVPRVFDPGEFSPEVRVFVTSKLMTLINGLEPYVNGSLGEVTPAHASAYVQALRELSRMWQVPKTFKLVLEEPVPEPEPEPEPEQLAIEAAAAVRAKVLDQLEQLRSR